MYSFIYIRILFRFILYVSKIRVSHSMLYTTSDQRSFNNLFLFSLFLILSTFLACILLAILSYLSFSSLISLLRFKSSSFCFLAVSFSSFNSFILALYCSSSNFFSSRCLNEFFLVLDTTPMVLTLKASFFIFQFLPFTLEPSPLSFGANGSMYFLGISLNSIFDDELIFNDE
ncbi:conserved hypothetical protein [Candida tropicalis MYA-3404]|uniref:Uncharacterized protein n=1 Tax=Candida tropicalis (strain ATCC MYA-3404 / T1) TaxID=294747 RepID=C5MCY4_CANTT|nr:conserved hypothetical protein [Candida tropicalis MYA-3404]EER32414.1 conserved hypothetical protein [Candida tropicalis MYA-3404]KAG4406028.1 hypothetical protein JTP64_004899 [Candida tropicalis]